MYDPLFEKSGLSLERLHTLLRVYDAGSISAASGSNLAQQSQYSRQLKELSIFFNKMPMLEDKGRCKELTPKAKELAKLAKLSFDALLAFYHAAHERPNRYVIGAGDSLIQWMFLPRYHEIQKEFADVSLVFKNLNTLRMSEGLKDGSLHLALMDAQRTPDGCEPLKSFSYGFRLVVPKALCLPRPSKSIDRMLSGVPMAVLEGKGSVRAKLESRLQKKSLAMNVRLECTSYPQIAVAIQEGGLAGVLPDYAMPAFFEKVAQKDFEVLTIPDTNRKVIMVARTETLNYQADLRKDMQRLVELLVR